MQDELDFLNSYARNHKISVNHQKTKIMLFSRHIKYDFVPELQLIENQNIEVVEEMKIVGFVLRSDLKTCSNTSYIVKKAYGRMWILRRLKALGASRTRLLDVLQKQILSVLNLGVHKKFSKWFVENTATTVNTRAPNRTKYKPVYAKKAFFKNSPIPVLTSMANTQV